MFQMDCLSGDSRSYAHIYMAGTAAARSGECWAPKTDWIVLNDGQKKKTIVVYVWVAKKTVFFSVSTFNSNMEMKEK